MNGIVEWDGMNWQSLGSGLNSSARAIVVSGDDLLFGGSFTLAGNKSSFGIARWSGLGPPPPSEVPPAMSRVEAPRPNPFRDWTEIPFALSQPGNVRVAVFDAQGREIAVLVNESRPAGTYVARWNGRDMSGNTVATGVYYVGAALPGGPVLGRKVVTIR